MGIGVGIVLIVIGLILVLGVVNFDTGWVDETTLGWILLIAGVVGIILGLIMNQQRTRRTHTVEERRYDDPPPRA